MWKEAAWTAGTIKEEIQGTDSGRDLYLMGIPRGAKVYSITATNTLKISNTGGWIVNMISGGNTSTHGSSMVAIIDGERKITVSQTYTHTAGIKVNGDAFGNGADFLYGTQTLLNDVTLSDKQIEINTPIRFNHSLDVTISNNAAFVSFQYVLDENVGGVTRKPTQITHARITALNPDFVRRCAA